MAIDFKKIPSPCFLLEERLLKKNLELIRQVQDRSGVKIIMALKGFAMYQIFPLIHRYLSGTTASSLHEARLGYEEFSNEVHLCAPAYRDDEFENLMKYCSYITFNSLNQWEHFRDRVQRSQKKISCAIRINPEYSEVQTDLYNPCISGSRLGMTAKMMGRELPEGMEGLHFHTLCEKNSDALERTLEHVEAKFETLLHKAKWLNMGGGHLITREGYDAEHLIALLKKIHNKYEVEIILEPGAAIAWRTGYLVSTVLDIMEWDGIHVAILDISFANHIADCIEMPFTPQVMGAKILESPEEASKKLVYRLGGLTCLAGDHVGFYEFAKPLSIGDLVIIEDMMHYTMVKTTTFNGVNLPSHGIWKENNTFELVKQFGYEEYKSRI